MRVPTEEPNIDRRIQRLVIVSNRLPVILTRGDEGEWQVEPGSGGLVTALAPILRDWGGLWIGWPGTVEKGDLDNVLATGSEAAGYALTPVTLSEEEVNRYYLGFSNEIIWPLFHDLQTRCNFDPAYWDAYQEVNRKFAQVIAQNSNAHDYIWVHDYHLMLVARQLRDMGVERKIGFFLHTPFPPLDIFVKLPWRLQILDSLMDYDLFGVQTTRDRNNLLDCMQALVGHFRADARRRVAAIATPGREVRIGSFPISIDFNEFNRQARDAAVVERTREVREAMGECQTILGVDRLDYSKGIPEKLKAFRRALERFEDLRGKVTLVQVAVPSREDIPEYQSLRGEIEGLVGEINGQFTEPGWVPIHYVFRHLPRDELVAHYRAADIALITSLKDGMNLVAKEYCAANVANDGVLILSEFAGAAAQLRRNALVVNPYDIDGVADAIHRAYQMSSIERAIRMRRLRRSVRIHDIFWWMDSFLTAAIARDLDALAELSGFNLLRLKLDGSRK